MPVLQVCATKMRKRDPVASVVGGGAAFSTLGVVFLLLGASEINAHGHEYEDHHHHHGDELGHDHDHGHDHGHDHYHEHEHEHGHKGVHGKHKHLHDQKEHHNHDHGELQLHGLEKSFHHHPAAGHDADGKLHSHGILDGECHDHEHPNHDDHDHDHHLGQLPGYALYGKAILSSILVSMASLPCVLLVPFIVRSNGKPSKAWVDALAGFGAGSMLGDVFLHQLPHAFSATGDHDHSHSHSQLHLEPHSHDPEGGHAHAHSIADLSVGLAVLGGILLFFVVEKIVRQFDSEAGHERHGSHHHHHRSKLDTGRSDNLRDGGRGVKETEEENEGDVLKRDDRAEDFSRDLRRRNVNVSNQAEGIILDRVGLTKNSSSANGKETKDPSRLVLGYLNLFSDGVHNFTDGMALGSAFIVRGTVGGWSRTLFLLAHELPQEVGDYGILLSSGFGVFEALTFNFLSALMALAGTVLALLAGGDSLHSSMIEGFTAGGFVYIAVGSVMPDMHSQGVSLKTTVAQVMAISLGVGVALAISLAE